MVNIESHKKFGKKKKVKNEKESLKEESKEMLNSQSSYSVLKADQVAIMQPILMQLKKSLIEDAQKKRSKSKSNNGRKKSKRSLYRHVKSKVTQSINGRTTVKFIRVKRRRRL